MKKIYDPTVTIQIADKYINLNVWMRQPGNGLELQNWSPNTQISTQQASNTFSAV